MIRLAIAVAEADAEIVLAELLELVPEGAEESTLPDGRVEYAIYGAPGELPSLPELSAAVGGVMVEVSTSEVEDDWSERWKQFHRPILIEGSGPPARALHVRAPWQPRSGVAGAQEIVIDPGQAFGTGAHQTTRLCLRLLLEVARRVAAVPVVDIGTGSGVLAIAAAKLGLRPVIALDSDPESVRAAAANAQVNGVAGEVRVGRLDLRRDPLPDLAGSIVLANLLRPLLITLAERLPHAPAQLIASGLLVGEADEVCAAFGARAGMVQRARLRDGEWEAVLLQATAPRP